MEKSFQYDIKNVGHLPKVLEWRHVKDPPPEYPPKPQPRFIRSKAPASPSDANLPEDFYT